MKTEEEVELRLLSELNKAQDQVMADNCNDIKHTSHYRIYGINIYYTNIEYTKHFTVKKNK